MSRIEQLKSEIKDVKKSIELIDELADISARDIPSKKQNLKIAYIFHLSSIECELDRLQRNEDNYGT